MRSEEGRKKKVSEGEGKRDMSTEKEEETEKTRDNRDRKKILKMKEKKESRGR